MSNTRLPFTDMEIQPRPPMELEPYLKRQQVGQTRSYHERFSPALPPYPNWTNFTSQQHMRAIALDTIRGHIWLVTWGGVLCWIPATGQCIRHTSEHGLVGNATRSLAVDAAGVVWACSQGGELCSLIPGAPGGWQPYTRRDGWAVQDLTARSGGGVYAMLRDTRGRGALGILDAPGAKLERQLEGSPACTGVEAFLAEETGALWLGNAWGLYYYPGYGEPDYIDLSVDEEGRKGVRVRVRALAPGKGRELWVGTNWGLYRFHRDRRTHAPAVRELYDEVLSLAWDSERGHLWVGTSKTVGHVVDDTWRPLRQPPPGECSALFCGRINTRCHIWGVGINGFYEIEEDKAKLVLEPSPEDTLSNAVHNLCFDSLGLWVGTARGLYLFDGEAWKRPICSESGLDDATSWNVQAMAFESGKERLWIGAGRSGLRRLRQGVDLPSSSPAAHIIAVAIGSDGSIWTATPDTIYWQLATGSQWEHMPISGRSIQTLYYQLASEAHGRQVGTLWVGTSQGLFRYRRELDQLEPAPGDLQHLSIRALTLDPLSEQLWIGTNKGLFSSRDWQRHHKDETDVRALAFTPLPDGMLWLGTAHGLEQWPAPWSGPPGDQPLKHFTVLNSGLAANLVTALTVRVRDNEYEVWVGTLAGVSCYRSKCSGN